MYKHQRLAWVRVLISKYDKRKRRFEKKDTDMALPFWLKQSRIIATNGDNTYSQHAGSLTELLMGRWQARTAFERDSRRGEVEQAMKRPVQQLSGSCVLRTSSSDDSGEEDV